LLRPAWRAIFRPIWRRLGELRYAAKEAHQDLRLGISTYVRPPTAPICLTDERLRYEALNYRAIRLISDRLALGADDVLCDAGCGMGRIICFFASSPLKACVGVEYDPALADAARRNIARLRGRRSPATVVTGDAACHDYGQVTALFMYNPFGMQTLRAVLGSLSSSLDTNPRRIQIAYANPVHQAVFDEFPAFVERERFPAPYLLAPMDVTIWSTVER
jgi:hypothetical protein